MRERLRGDLHASALCAAVVFGCVVASLLFVEAGEVAALWPSNAVILAFALRNPGGRTAWILSAAWVANLAADLAVGAGLLQSLALSTSNLVEVVVCLWLLGRWIGGAFDLARPRHLAVLVAAAVLAPVLSGSMAASMLHFLRGSPFQQTFSLWWCADSLGLITLTPAFLTLSPRRLARLWRPHLRAGTAGVALLVAVMLLIVFGQARYPLTFLAPAVLMLTAFYRGLSAAVAAVLAVVVAAVTAALFNLGPTALIDASLTERVLLQQLFLAVMVLVTLPVAVAMAHRRRLERSLRRARVAAERSERRYRMMAEQVTDVIFRFDVSGRGLWISPSCTPMLGYSHEELVGRSLLEFLHPDDAPRVADVLWGMVRERLTHAPEPIEYRVRRADGSWMWAEAKPTLTWGPDGRAIEFLDVVRDITARKAADAELAEARRQAEAAAAAKSDFLATMSHELRTPLTSIIGFSGLLAESGRLGADESRYVERIRVASDALLSIVNDVLDYSKLEAGAVELDPRPFGLHAMVAETLGLVAQQAQAKGLALAADLAPGAADALLVGDGPRLRQVLLNFLSNAVKFTGRGGVTVRAEMAAEGEEQVRLRVEVADTGIGVAPEKLDQLFERFVQADGSISRRFGGTGLGLSISRRLIELMGGEIGAESRLGQGSTFWFSVPLATAAALDREVEAQAAPIRPARVLMVDDNEANRELVCAVLGALGLEVDTAEDGAQAVEAVSARAYDLVLMDVHMPVMDGLEATRTIRRLGARFAGLPIVALTANVQPEHVARCREAGMDDHVGKPIVPAQLYAALGRWLTAEAA